MKSNGIGVFCQPIMLRDSAISYRPARFAQEDARAKANQAAADQVNRRTEFMVLSTNFQPFADDLKRMQALQDSIRQVERENDRAEKKAREQEKRDRERAKRLGIPYVPSEPKSAPAPADGENVPEGVQPPDDGKKPDDVKKPDDEKKADGDEKKPDDLRRSVKHNTRAKEKQ